jgi:erythromycin esterase-like protein
MASVVRQIKEFAHIFSELPKDYNSILECISDETRVVMIGEASHGTHEFYKHRAEITKRLVEEKGFSVVAVEADWPDAYRVNKFIKKNIKSGDQGSVDALGSFERFPRWMWRNVVVADFVNWMKARNDKVQNKDQVGFYGLDLYSLQSSRSAVIEYLEKVDKTLAAKARKQYGCFDKFGGDSQTYGYKTGLGMSKSCEREVIDVLKALLAKQADLMARGKDDVDDDDAFFYAQQNAILVRDAESYYRNMFVGENNTWNIRDTHMLETLKALVSHFSEKNGKPAKAVVWAHNSHLGDASQTSMKDRGEVNLGQLVRETYSMDKCYNIGFTTYAGTVTAAHNWDEDPQFMVVKRGMDGSYEKLLHDATGHMGLSTHPPPYSLVFRSNTKSGEKNLVSSEVKDKLYHQRLERAIGVIYRPETEIFSHYFKAHLPTQFDAVIHVDTTLALVPLEIRPQWVKSHREHIPSAFPGLAHLDANQYDVGFFDPSQFDWTNKDFINEAYQNEYWSRKNSSA